MLVSHLIPDPGRPARGRFLLLGLGSVTQPKKKATREGGDLRGL
jgi:hypothetical protein